MIEVCIVVSLALGVLCFYFIILALMLQSSYNKCELEKLALQSRLLKCSSHAEELRTKLQNLLITRGNT